MTVKVVALTPEEELEQMRDQLLNVNLLTGHSIADDYTPDEWADFINRWAEIKGWNQPRSEAEWAALAHTEISEAFECYRNGELLVHIKEGKPEGTAVEYADALIRIFHWFAQHGVSPQQVLTTKMLYNLDRPFRHGDKKA